MISTPCLKKYAPLWVPLGVELDGALFGALGRT